MTQQEQVPSRHRAGMFDIPVKGDESTHGVCASPDAIGGYYGMGWYEYFKDAETGEVYRVHCSDGVYGGNSSYTADDERWRHEIYYEMIRRCHEAAKSGVEEIRISRNERVCMQGFTHTAWLESAEGQGDGKQSDDGLEGGLVGHCHGVPIICDVEQEDNLPPRPPKPETEDREVA